MADSPDPWNAPERIGRYQVFPAFARGGTASVHIGRLDGPSGFSRLVAIKRLHVSSEEREQHARRLLEEARLTARIRSPYIIPVHEIIHEDGQLCMVMELVLGVSLAHLLSPSHRSGAGIPPEVATTILSDALRGLHAAHEATGPGGASLELVHRDVSPQNVLVGADGVTRVLDFGIARAVGREPLTRTGEVHGKLAYMAPEQLRGGAVARQADVYAVGVMAWEALTGKRLRRGQTPEAVAAEIGETVPPLVTDGGDLLSDLDAVVREALAPEERRRFATAEAMAIALEEACPPASREEVARFVERVADAEVERLATAMSVAESAAAPSPPLVSTAHISHVPKMNKKARMGLALLGLAAVLLAAVVAIASGTSRPTAPVPDTAAPSSGPSGDTPPASTASVSTAVDEQAPHETAPPPPSATATHARKNPRRVRVPASSNRACTPPFELDSSGNKHYKPGCL